MNWNIDPTHSEVQFKVKHLVISTVTGSFTSYQGNVTTEQEDSFNNAVVNFSLDVDSVSTAQPDRDNHLKSAEFFDAEKFPHIKLSEGKLVATSGDNYELHGNLTIKETTKPIVLQTSFGGIMKDPWGNIKAGFELSGTLNRKDFGMTWNAALEAGGVLVGEDVRLLMNIQLAKG